MTPTQPDITLITPSLNRGNLIGATLDSVVCQELVGIEHLIMDKGSTDNTHQTVESYPHAKLVVGNDAGSHDAMNLGVQIARGQIIGFINTDDLLPKGALHKVLQTFANNPKSRVLRGDAGFFTQDGTTTLSKSLWKAPTEDDLAASLMFGVPCFNAWFFRRSVFDDIGEFDNDFDLSADREFLLRLITREQTTVVDHVLYLYRVHSGSRTMGTASGRAKAIAVEHSRIACRILEQKDMLVSKRKLARAFAAIEKARLAWYALRAGDLVQATRAMFAVARGSATWPIDVARALGRKRRIYRTYWQKCVTAKTQTIDQSDI